MFLGMLHAKETGINSGRLGLLLVWRALHLFTLPIKKISLDRRQLLFKVKLSKSRQIVWRRELDVDRGRQVLIYVWNSWVNNKTVNELGFLMIWRIVQISESVIRLCPRPRRISDPPSLCNLHNSSYHSKAEPLLLYRNSCFLTAHHWYVLADSCGVYWL